MMKVGEVRVADDEDFTHFKNLCDNHDGWHQVYNKHGVLVWTKSTEMTSFKMVKIRTEFKDIDAEVLYDVIHDPEYRKTWDHNMMEGREICMLNPNNDIGYYAIRCPTPVKNRDFVTQRSWIDTGSEKIIFNHSVNHEKQPVRKSCIRGTSYLTGYLIRPTGTQGCQLTYVAQSDPKGKLPAWAINKLTTFVAPKVASRLHKAALKYTAWKDQNRKDFKPWRNPEQMVEVVPRLDMGDIKDLKPSEASSEASSEAGDESEIAEADLTEDAGGFNKEEEEED